MLQGLRVLDKPEQASPTVSKSAMTPPPPQLAEMVDEEAIARKTSTIIEELVQNRDFEVYDLSSNFSLELILLDLIIAFPPPLSLPVVGGTGVCQGTRVHWIDTCVCEGCSKLFS